MSRFMRDKVVKRIDKLSLTYDKEYVNIWIERKGGAQMKALDALKKQGVIKEKMIAETKKYLREFGVELSKAKTTTGIQLSVDAITRMNAILERQMTELETIKLAVMTIEREGI